MKGARWSELLRSADGAGEFAEPTARSGEAEHPVCGDRVQLSVRNEQGTIRGVRWRASACPATTAVATLAARVLVDVPIAEAGDRLRAAVLELGGLEAHERHAEAVVLKALAAATER